MFFILHVRIVLRWLKSFYRKHYVLVLRLPQAAFRRRRHFVLFGHKYMMRVLCVLLLVGACGTTSTTDSVITAQPYIGLEERSNRKEIRELTGVDPVRTEWCAAFANAVLELDGIPSLNSQDIYPPLMARSFLYWGTRVQRSDVQRGDIVVFPRGNQGWQGHVGFYVETQTHDGRDYWVILGGNQDNTVSYQLFDPRRAISIRRHIDPDATEKTSIALRLSNLYSRYYSDDV